MTGAGESSHEDELVRLRVQHMKDAELVDFIRETVTRLDTLADRLEAFTDVDKGKGEGYGA